MPNNFDVGMLYSNEEIYASLRVGNAGGVRIKTARGGSVRRLVIMTAVPDARQLAENPYHDRIEGDVLIYTGAGRTGNQNLAGANQRIPQQITDGFPIYGFMLMKSRRDASQGSKRWTFLGLLQYLRHYPEAQRDVAGKERRAWVFEMRICNDPARIPIVADVACMERLMSARPSDGDELEVVGKLPQGEEQSREEQVAIEATRARLLACEPRPFEFFIKEVLSHSGFEKIEVTKYSQDGGIDVHAYPGRLSWPIRSLLVQLQAKRWLHSVGRKEFAELRGSLQAHARGCIVTTSHYSRAAIAESNEPGKIPITLVDGYEFARIVHSLRVPI
jgi:restriction endonuclease